MGFEFSSSCAGFLCTHIRISRAQLYRWVPLYPNMDNPDSQFEVLYGKRKNPLMSACLPACLLNLKFAKFEGFSLVIYVPNRLRGFCDH